MSAIIRPSLAEVIVALEESGSAKQDEAKAAFGLKGKGGKEGTSETSGSGDAPAAEKTADGINKADDGQYKLQLWSIAEAVDKQINELISKDFKNSEDKASTILQNS
jgi:hypothetical protein